jgi:pyruvate,water dikinase
VQSGQRPPVRWIRENEFDPRLAFWTRANISEVLPEPPSPLGFDSVFEGACVSGWRDVLIHRLGMEQHELDPDRVEAVGVFGGYGYLGAALFRVWAGRTPGMTPTTIDEFYFGDRPDVPPYVAEPWHVNPHTTEVMTRWLQWATVDLDQGELEADREESLRIRAQRPDYSALSDDELFDYVVSMRPLLRRMFNQHINQSAAASVGPGILGQVCAAIGQPGSAMALMSGLGHVDSAEPAYAMWDLSRTVRASPALTRLFDEGVHGLLERADGDDDATVSEFADAIGRFLAEFGSRGPNEWDLVADVWEVAPATALAAIDRMRAVDDADSPALEHEARERTRAATEADVRAALEGNTEALAAFEIGLRSASTFLRGRERSKTTIVRVIHEMRLATRELGRRFTDRGAFNEPSDIHLLFLDELSELIAGNLPDVTDTIPPRAEYYAWLKGLEPPFIINGPPPPNTTWPAKDAHVLATLGVGDTVSGVPGCPGQAQGRARVILDPTDPSGLEAGDVLVAPGTDPSWTPLFVGAAGVVVDVGAALSHAVIVSRELGIPCVPSAAQASKRIVDGSIIHVDGDAGIVTVVALPDHAGAAPA